MKIDGEEVQIWKHDTPEYTEFYLRSKNHVANICAWPSDTANDWLLMTGLHTWYGNRCDPISFLVITGYNVERVWRFVRQCFWNDRIVRARLSNILKQIE